MNLDGVIYELVVIQNQLGRVLDGPGLSAVESALARMKIQKPRRKRRGPGNASSWHLVIPPEQPLSFKETHIRSGHRLYVDLFCNVSEPVNGRPSDKHCVVVRVWALDQTLWYRKYLDCREVLEGVAAGSGKRVMLRFHFDYAQSDGRHPSFHMQIGGNPQEDEFCWHPKEIDCPRFVHYPLDLLMVCELVVANFYPDDYSRISKETTWIGALNKAQHEYIDPYLEHVSSFGKMEKESFLWHLWQWNG